MDVLKTSNPAFRDSMYRGQGMHAAYGETMTVEGTIHRTGILLLCVLGTAFWTWSRFLTTRDPAAVALPLMVGVFGGLIMALVTTFKKEWSPVTAPLCSL